MEKKVQGGVVIGYVGSKKKEPIITEPVVIDDDEIVIVEEPIEDEPKPAPKRGRKK